MRSSQSKSKYNRVHYHTFFFLEPEGRHPSSIFYRKWNHTLCPNRKFRLLGTCPSTKANRLKRERSFYPNTSHYHITPPRLKRPTKFPTLSKTSTGTGHFQQETQPPSAVFCFFNAMRSSEVPSPFAPKSQYIDSDKLESWDSNGQFLSYLEH